MAHNHSHSEHAAPTGTTEPDVVNIRTVVNFAIGLTVVTVIAHLAMLLMFRVMANAREAENPPRMFPLKAIATEPQFPGDPSGDQPPEPRLQTSPKQDLIDLRKGEDVILNGYSWVDRNNNVVRIPIAEAKKLTLQRGLPARQAGEPAAAVTPATQEQGKDTRK